MIGRGMIGRSTPVAGAAAPGEQGRGLPVMQFTIEEVTEDGRVMGVDQFGKRRTVPLYMRSKGANPRPGEVWFIDRSMGYWMLSAVKDPSPREVTGSRSQNAALASLLSAMQSDE